MNSNSLLARLEELKKWQEKQQERLLQQQTFRGDAPSSNSREETPKNFVRSEEPNLKSGGNPVIVRVENPRKPKRPFLKRGAGLARYKMTNGDRKKPYGQTIAVNRKKENLADVPVNKNIEELKLEVKKVASPLKMPNFDMKLSGETKTGKIDEETLVKQTISNINEMAKIDHKSSIDDSDAAGFFLWKKNKNDFNYQLDNCEEANETNDEIPQTGMSDETLYEKNLERELLIFEALEEKILNSSFSSTNSSVLKILSSTPNKLKDLRLKKNETKENKEDDKKEIDEEINHKLLEEVIQEEYTECPSSASSSVYSEEKTVGRLEDECENNWCTEETDETSSVLSETTENESTTLENLIETKEFVSTSINTEFLENSVEILESDDESLENHIDVEILKNPTENQNSPNDLVSKSNKSEEILTEKLKELDREIQNFRIENAKLQRKKLELEKRESSLKKEKKEFEKYVMEEKIKVEFYLEDEKKKFAKEKFVFERYVKDAQNKTNRKEREEITTLKDEIANIKEASKLKETRNATSQARLRNQIKNYEKEINNLKEELEKLRKQNARLNTSQKYNKKSDSKVLQEINRNLSKLTKEVKPVEKEQRISPIKVIGLDEETENKKIIIESPKTLERKAQELVDENLVKTYEEVFGRNSTALLENVTLNDSKMSKTETILTDGSKEIKYSNGNVKTISADGNFVTMKYFNGDLKETKLTDEVVKYFYAENQSWHTTYPDGMEIIEFTNGQTETKHKDGRYEVKLPNGIVKVTHADRSEKVVYPDGMKVNVSVNGDKEIVLPNGQKEIHTKEHMRREYLDGTVKILYPDGIQETRYSNGRIRIKDKDGKLLLDSHDENT